MRTFAFFRSFNNTQEFEHRFQSEPNRHGSSNTFNFDSGRFFTFKYF